MPRVFNQQALKDAYNATRLKLKGSGDPNAAHKRDILPTRPIFPDHFVFRSIDPARPLSWCPKPEPGMPFPSPAAINPLIPLDGKEHDADPGRRWDANRFTGLSGVSGIAPISGLYCVLQQQALINESMHYSGKPGVWAINGKCVLKIRINQTKWLAELSPHNENARRFIRGLGKDMWEKMNDPNDASVARGIGLALAHSGILDGIIVQTVRGSERSDEERGDNLVLFTSPGTAVAGIAVVQASYYGRTHVPDVFSARSS